MLYVLVFSVGVFLSPLIPSYVPVSSLWFAGVFTACLCAALHWWRYKALAITNPLVLVNRMGVLSRIAGMLFVGVMALGFGASRIHYIADQQLGRAQELRDVQVVFSVESLVKRKTRSIQFVGRVLDVTCHDSHKVADEHTTSPQSCPNIKGKNLNVSWFQPTQEINPGEHWHAVVRLKRPRGFVNPAGFDYHAWLLGQGISATAYIRAKNTKPEKLGESQNMASMRDAVKKQVFTNGDLRSERFFKALLVGDKTDISTDDWHVLQVTGTIHLMAISGLHIGLIAGFGFFVALWIARFGVVLPGSNALFYQRFPLMVSLVCAGIYAALAGFTVPTTRAFVACACLCIFTLMCKRVSASRLLLLVFLVVCLLQPFAVLNSGFWLSFLAVGALMYCFSGRAGGFWLWVRAQWVLLLALCVPLLVLSQGVSWLSPVANALAIPIVSFIVVPLLFAGAVLSAVLPSFSQLLLQGADFVFIGLWGCLEWLSNWGSFLWPLNRISLASISVMAVAVLMMLAPADFGLRRLGATLCFAAVLLPSSQHSALKLTVLDVGQGLAVVLETPEKTWVYDTGLHFSSTFDTGQHIISPYLHQQGIRNIGLIVSHSDADHSGGAKGLAALHPVMPLISGEPISLPGLTPEPCKEGLLWQTESVRVDVLWPDKESANHKARHKGSYHKNNASCVVLIQASIQGETVAILLPGDVDKTAEAAILDLLPRNMDVVVAAHHGSKTSSHQAFVQHVAPRYAVMSAGFNNRYHHPNKHVVARYKQVGAEVLNTATSGAISFTWNQQGALNVEELRRTKARVWY